jgi:hypothetical protein
MKTFRRDGVSFHYPENWTAEVEDSADGGWTVTVSSPRTAFLIISLQPDACDPTHLADQTLEALKADYQELDSEHQVETLSGRPAVGHDIDFLTIDVPVVARIRCLEAPGGPLLVLAQTAEPDRERYDPVLRAVVASLVVEED